MITNEQRWSRKHKARGQGQLFRGQTLSRPRTGILMAKDQEDTSASVLKKKKGLQKIFQAFSSKKGLPKIFFRRSTKFQQFKKKCGPRSEDRAIFKDLRPRGQGLDLREQSQGLQNESSRPRTSSRTPPLLTSSIGSNE